MRQTEAYANEVAETLRQRGIEIVHTHNQESDSISGTRDGSGFVILLHYQPGEGIVGNVTITPFRGNIEVYPDDRFEEGMERVQTLFGRGKPE